MRIYLTQSVDVHVLRASGRSQRVSYPSAGFYNAPDELAQDWIARGLAFSATPDNRVIAYRGEHLEHVDFDAGQKFAPEHTALPVVAATEPPPAADAGVSAAPESTGGEI